MKKFIESLFKVSVAQPFQGTTCWAVFPGSWDDDRIFDFIEWAEDRYLLETGISRSGYYHGAGQAYSDGAYIRRQGKRALIKQQHSYDV